MEYRRIGKSGLKVSMISIGGWLTAGSVVDESKFHQILHGAFERGVNFLDLADIYARGEAEVVCGRFLVDYPRHQLVLSSKCFWPMSEGINDRGLSRKHIVESVEKTLRRLGTDYLDLYFCHRFDPDSPLDETIRAMEDLIRQGKILYWGTSVWSSSQLREANRIAGHYNAYQPIVEQPMYNLYERGIELEVMPTVKDLGMGLVVWSPLAGGVLTGKYSEGIPKGTRGDTTHWLDAWLDEESQKKNQRFVQLAREVGVKPGQLALAWILKHPEISSVITGATSIEQLNENLDVLSFDLSDEVFHQLNSIFV